MMDKPKEKHKQGFLFDEVTAGMLTANQHDQNALQDLGMLMPLPGGGEIIKAIIGFTMLFFQWLAFPVEMIIRKDFGIRYVSFLRWMVSNTILGIIGLGLILIFDFDVLTWVYSATVTVMAFRHNRRAKKRQKQGEIWFTMSWGISRFQWLLGKINPGGRIPYLPHFDDWFLYRFVEPAFCLVLGLIFFQIENGFGFLFLVSTLGLFLKANISYSAALNRVYDIIDAAIEGEYYSVSASGAPKQETAGFAAVRLPEGLNKYTSANQAARDVAQATGTLTQRIHNADKRGLLNNS